MATYVLIHGGQHGGWCWDKVAPLIREKGHIVETPDLPGHGKDKTPIGKVTLQVCVDKVSNILKTCSEPVILVGHSTGGLVISQVGEQVPDKIKTLVYLAAIMLRNGETWTPEIERCRSILNISQDQRYFTLKDEVIVERYYNDCSSEDIARAKMLLGPEAMIIFNTPLKISNKRFGNIPRIYIECLNDHTVSPQLQKLMYTSMPCQVISFNTGHSPFLSAPVQLATYLLSLSK